MNIIIKHTQEGNKGIILTLILSLTTGNLKLITALLQMINAGYPTLTRQNKLNNFIRNRAII